MQAFNQGMAFVDSVLGGQMLVYAAISPNIATARYVHMRRIGCDAFSAIDNTEYTLNSSGYGWWQSGIYDFVDADHVVFSNAPDGVNRARLVASIVDIGRTLGIKVVAEGVATMEHARVLAEIGCDFLQGYAFARPMPARELEAWARPADVPLTRNRQ